MAVNPYIGVREIAVEVRHLFDSPGYVQADEQWGYVGNKDNQRCLWYAIDAATGCILSFVFGRRQDKVCERLISNLKVFNIQTYYTDDWGSYSKLITEDKHVIGKQNTQKIEKKPFFCALESSGWRARPFAFQSQRCCMVPSSGYL